MISDYLDKHKPSVKQRYRRFLSSYRVKTASRREGVDTYLLGLQAGLEQGYRAGFVDGTDLGMKISLDLLDKVGTVSIGEV